MARLRRSILATAFGLLYGPLSWLHEPAGRLLNGAAWDGRRSMALYPPVGGRMLDLGCGDGRLLARAGSGGVAGVGVDPSPAMVRRARRRGLAVVRGDAAAIPLAGAAVNLVTSTYPGEWIFTQTVLAEIVRVLRPGGEVRVLLGGTTTAGRLPVARSLVQRLVYGRSGGDQLVNPPAVDGLDWIATARPDQWGESYWWIGTRSARG